MIKSIALAATALLFAAGSALAIPTISVNCGSKTINIGDSLNTVKEACGKADKMQSKRHRTRLFYMNPTAKTKLQLLFKKDELRQIEVK